MRIWRGLVGESQRLEGLLGGAGALLGGAGALLGGAGARAGVMAGVVAVVVGVGGVNEARGQSEQSNCTLNEALTQVPSAQRAQVSLQFEACADKDWAAQKHPLFGEGFGFDFCYCNVRVLDVSSGGDCAHPATTSALGATVDNNSNLYYYFGATLQYLPERTEENKDLCFVAHCLDGKEPSGFNMNGETECETPPTLATVRVAALPAEGGGATILGADNGEAVLDSVVTVVATPAEGWYVDRWEGDGGACAGQVGGFGSSGPADTDEKSCSLAASAGLRVTVRFASALCVFSELPSGLQTELVSLQIDACNAKGWGAQKHIFGGAEVCHCNINAWDGRSGDPARQSCLDGSLPPHRTSGFSSLGETNSNTVAPFYFGATLQYLPERTEENKDDCFVARCSGLTEPSGFNTNGETECLAASGAICGGLTPAKNFDGVACVEGCAGAATLNSATNVCECVSPNVGTGADCRAPSGQSNCTLNEALTEFPPAERALVSLQFEACTDKGWGAQKHPGFGFGLDLDRCYCNVQVRDAVLHTFADCEHPAQTSLFSTVMNIGNLRHYFGATLQYLPERTEENKDLCFIAHCSDGEEPSGFNMNGETECRVPVYGVSASHVPANGEGGGLRVTTGAFAILADGGEGVVKGARVTFAASPAADFYVSGWSHSACAGEVGDETRPGEERVCAFAVEAGADVTVTFSRGLEVAGAAEFSARLDLEGGGTVAVLEWTRRRMRMRGRRLYIRIRCSVRVGVMLTRRFAREGAVGIRGGGLWITGRVLRVRRGLGSVFRGRRRMMREMFRRMRLGRGRFRRNGARFWGAGIRSWFLFMRRGRGWLRRARGGLGIRGQGRLGKGRFFCGLREGFWSGGRSIRLRILSVCGCFRGRGGRCLRIRIMLIGGRRLRVRFRRGMRGRGTRVSGFAKGIVWRRRRGAGEGFGRGRMFLRMLRRRRRVRFWFRF